MAHNICPKMKHRLFLIIWQDGHAEQVTGSFRDVVDFMNRFETHHIDLHNCGKTAEVYHIGKFAKCRNVRKTFWMAQDLHIYLRLEKRWSQKDKFSIDEMFQLARLRKRFDYVGTQIA
jgi:hypothetical protein